MPHPASLYRMLRWSKPSPLRTALLLVVLALPALPQFGGIQLPGQGRQRGGNNGGGRGQSGPQDAPARKVFGPTETLTGTLRDVSSTSLTLDAGDDKIVLIQIQTGTKYLSTMGKVKATDFDPGDHVTIDATRDENDHYYSKTVTMNKKGTAEEKSAAMQAAAVSTASAAGNTPDSDPERPRLRRGDSSSDSVTSPSSDNSPVARNAPPPSDSSDNSDRPRLRRNTSDAPPRVDDQAPVYAPAVRRSTSNTDSATVTSPPLITGSDTVGSSTTVAPRRPGVYQPSPTSYPSSSDDSSAPTLRRAASPSASPDVPTQSASVTRPTLSADDVNGVTRLPEIPPPGSVDNAGGPSRQTRPNLPTVMPGSDPVIDQAREEALSFSESLPNYVVKQFTSRYQSGAARGGRTSWQPLDIVTTDLIYEDGKERYTNIMVNGKPTKYVEQTGSWSEGEFGSMQQAILSPASFADFHNQRTTTIVNRTAYRYDYTIEQPRSTWSLHADGQTYSPSYTGAIWIDKETSRVLRIEIAARNLPRTFPLDTAESSIDYDFVLIGDKKVLMPAHSESLSCTRGTSDCSRNTTDFRNYKKYGAETNITFEGEK